jgi:hypothetical protein
LGYRLGLREKEGKDWAAGGRRERKRTGPEIGRAQGERVGFPFSVFI